MPMVDHETPMRADNALPEVDRFHGNVNTPFSTEFVSMPGGRELNEDHCDFATEKGVFCWVVADGLGGHIAGETASRLAVEEVLRSFHMEPTLCGAALRDHVVAAQTRLRRAQERDNQLRGMGTTIVILASDGVHAQWAHVGDSRLYWIHDGQIRGWTKDHSVPQALADGGEIAEGDIRFHVDRNRLLQAIGGSETPSPAILEQPLDIEPGDKFLLCTDGFWEYVREMEMEADLAKSVTPQGWLELLEGRLLSRAPTDHDNYTAMCAWRSEPVSAKPDQGEDDPGASPSEHGRS